MRLVESSKVKVNFVDFEDIKEGEAFIHAERIFIKTDEEAGVDLEDGQVVPFDDEYKVIPTRAEVHWTR
jgi:hypothetical protein